MSWAETCSDSTMRVAMVLRRRLSFSVLPRRGDGSAAARWSRRGRCGCRRLLGGVEDILLADAAADAGAGDGREVDAVLLGQLAHDRGDVGVAAALGGGSGRAGVGGRR